MCGNKIKFIASTVDIHFMSVRTHKHINTHWRALVLADWSLCMYVGRLRVWVWPTARLIEKKNGIKIIVSILLVQMDFWQNGCLFAILLILLNWTELINTINRRNARQKRYMCLYVCVVFAAIGNKWRSNPKKQPGERTTQYNSYNNAGMIAIGYNR